MTTAISATVTSPLKYDLSILCLNRPTSAAPIFHRSATTSGMLGFVCNLLETMLYKDAPTSMQNP
jgi:hypothetical protein